MADFNTTLQIITTTHGIHSFTAPVVTAGAGATNSPNVPAYVFILSFLAWLFGAGIGALTVRSHLLNMEAARKYRRKLREMRRKRRREEMEKKSEGPVIRYNPLQEHQESQDVENDNGDTVPLVSPSRDNLRFKTDEVINSPDSDSGQLPKIKNFRLSEAPRFQSGNSNYEEFLSNFETSTPEPENAKESEEEISGDGDENREINESDIKEGLEWDSTSDPASPNSDRASSEWYAIANPEDIVDLEKDTHNVEVEEAGNSNETAKSSQTSKGKKNKKGKKEQKEEILNDSLQDLEWDSIGGGI
eukprot:m.57621 g.57621  ORF g.57621 m.57621 type:complete len:303 (+) comp11120_c0_seq1:163-1071(+)